MDNTPDLLTSWIYRSSHKEEMYLYLRREGGFDLVPGVLLERFGRPEFVMCLELHTERQLARVDVATVMRQLQADGYYLQMPPQLRPHLYEGE